MAFDAFIKLDGIPGDSSDDKHKEWINVLSFSTGMSQPATMVAKSSAGAAGGRVEFSEFSFIHYMDKASPKLFLNCANGTHIPNVVVHLCRATGDKQKYLEYKLTDVIIASVRPGGSSGGGEDVPLEEVSLTFATIEVIYTETDAAGKAKGDIKAKYDLKAQKGT